MTSPLDTTLHHRAASAPPARRGLVVLCVAGRPILPPRPVGLSTGTLELGRAASPEPLGLAVDPTVSRRHAVIEVDDQGRATLARHGSARVEVNGAEVERAELQDGDVIVLGESVLVVDAAMGGAAPRPIAGIVGESASMRAVRRSVVKVGPTPVTVLVLGESGTGKELTARALHDASGREGPFVAVNCAAIPATLAESLLFGHTGGAFTGAQRASPGVFRAAEGGTLFLDELGDLPIDVQPKLLRAVEERAVVPVGAIESVPIDVRVIAATNLDLVDEIQAGRFRGDLYARLAEFTIHLPALRDRREDILPLLAHQLGGALPELRFELIRALLLHPWPFNARELRTAAAQLRLAQGDDAGPLGLATLGAQLGDTARLRAPASAPVEVGPAGAPSRPPAKKRAAAATKSELAALLRAHRGNVTELARAVSRSRKQVYRWLDAHQLDPESYRGG